MIVLPAIAIMIAGCADSRLAATNDGVGAQASGESTPARRSTPYQTGYGLTSDGPTTDLYTELFRPNARDDGSAAAPVSPGAVQQGQPAAMFLTDDVKGDYERIKARGAEFTMPPTDVTGSTIAVLKDTCGTLVQLTQLARY